MCLSAVGGNEREGERCRCLGCVCHRRSGEVAARDKCVGASDFGLGDSGEFRGVFCVGLVMRLDFGGGRRLRIGGCCVGTFFLLWAVVSLKTLLHPGLLQEANSSKRRPLM